MALLAIDPKVVELILRLHLNKFKALMNKSDIIVGHNITFDKSSDFSWNAFRNRYGTIDFTTQI